MGRLGFGFAGRRHGRGNTGPLPPMSGTVDASGWFAAVDRPRDLTMQEIPVQRAGFDAQGNAASHLAGIRLTKRVRRPWPDHRQASAQHVALSDYLYATDTPLGFGSDSVALAPKPMAAWVMPARECVGDSLRWEIVAFHRNARPDPLSGIGRQVACVRVRANSGSQQTAWQVVSETQISALCQDANPVEVFAADLDLTGLGDGAFWLEAEVMPWYGDAASVLRSEDNAQPREFSRRWFLKDAPRAAAPPLVYVASWGDDAAAAVSSDIAAAEAAPAATLGGAFARARKVLGNGQGAMDALRVRILDRVQSGYVPYQASYPQDVAAVVVERAPQTARADAVLEWTAHWRPRFADHAISGMEGALTFRDVTIERKGGYSFYGESAANLHVQLVDCEIDNGGNAGTWRATAHVSHFGGSLTGYNGSLAQSSGGEIRLLRGITADLTGGTFEGWVTVGSRLTGAGAMRSADPAKGAITYGNTFIAPAASTGPVVMPTGPQVAEVGPIAVVQNLIEVTHTEATAPSMAIGASSEPGNITHAVIQHNTGTGVGQLGRWNLFYDEQAGFARSSEQASFAGNLAVQLNTKGDIFHQDAGRTGQFAFAHGVGCAGNFSVAMPNAPVSEAQEYAGPGSLIGAGDPAFADYRGTTGSVASPVAGAGGGDYRLTMDSPARELLAAPVLAFDLAGAPRGNGAQAAGAYA